MPFRPNYGNASSKNVYDASIFRFRIELILNLREMNGAKEYYG